MRRHLYFIVLIVAILCLAQAAYAQSGRRQTKPPAPTTAPAPAPAPAPDAEPEPVPGISKIIVVGDLIDFAEYRHSDFVKTAVKAAVKKLKEEASMDASGSGSLKREAAIAHAKEQTDAYVLLMEIGLKDNGFDAEYRPREEGICVIDYYLLLPKTGKVLINGRVDPNNQRVLMGGAVLRLPKGIRSLPLDIQLEEGGKMVADKVRRRLQ